jgi:hypothetical protein
MVCTFNVLKSSDVRLLNTFDSRYCTEELMKSRDIRPDSSLPLKILINVLPTVNNFFYTSVEALQNRQNITTKRIQNDVVAYS